MPAETPTVLIDCAVGHKCQLVGILNIFQGVPASGATLEWNGKCIPVALAPSVIRDWKYWNGKKVIVLAQGMQRAREEPEVAFVEYQDRKLASGMCAEGEIVAYADSVKMLK